MDNLVVNRICMLLVGLIFRLMSPILGGGKPDCMVPGIVNSDGIGKAYILDEANGDGFVVSVRLQPFHIDALKKLFYEDMEMITSSKL
uniref:Shikimate O-hydroxycinnamoyltransferase n=1 Tax=Medicago truncatula TaxID=3880 RepID=I3S5E6_MEDTR|nr:unknown [Medicago truncatula]